jgi:hypothetical protein
VVLKSILLEPTPKTPLVDFNNLTGELILSGKSIPENAALIYEGLMKWIVEYVKKPRKITNLRLSLEYFNTATAIWLGKIVQALSSMKDPENTLMIHLYFRIEEFDSMDTDDLKDELHPLIHLIGIPTINIGLRIYGTDEKNEILKESMILL